MTIVHEYLQLINLIKKCDDWYYNYASPIISDEEYDKAKYRAIYLKENYSEILNFDNSLDEKIGHSPNSPLKKVEHLQQMLSLDNAFTEQDVIDFYDKILRFLNKDKIDINAELKIDGLSVSLIYQNGILYRAATRGDGTIGEDVTHNAFVISDIPKTIAYTKDLEVRGEIFVTKSEFEHINNIFRINDKKTFANPRNFAAGSMRQLDATQTKSRNLRFFAYSAIGLDNIATQVDCLVELKRLNFPIIEYYKLCHTPNEMIDFYNIINSRRDSIDYDIDGVVYKINDLMLQDQIGYTARAPRYAIAHKFISTSSHSKVIDIIAQVGRTGAITPVAILEPTSLNGVVINRATLHNYDELVKKNIAINDIVHVKRAGDVIPQITEIKEHGENRRYHTMPSACPSCGHNVIKKDATLRCMNGLNCREQAIETIVHFASREAADIRGLGRRNVEILYDKGMIQTIDDIFILSQYKDNLITLPGWGNLSVKNLLESIENSRNIATDKFIYSIGIPQIGPTTAKLLAEYYTNVDVLLNIGLEDEKTAVEQLSNMNNIGPSIASEIYRYCQDFGRRKTILSLIEKMNIFKHEVKNDHILSGKTVVFTGTLNNITRAMAKHAVEKNGGTTSNYLSKNIDFVVVGSNAGSKLVQAKEYKIKIIDEDEFIKNFM